MVKITSSSGRKSPAKEVSDLLILPCWQDKKKALPAHEAAVGLADEPLGLGDFRGKAEETLLLYPPGLPEKRLLLVGLGPIGEVEPDLIRRAYGAAAKEILRCRVQKVSLYLPRAPKGTNLSILEADLVLLLTEGLLLASERFQELRSEQEEDEEELPLTDLHFLETNASRLEGTQHVLAQIAGVRTARTLVLSNADDVTPEYLATFARQLGRQYSSIKATCWSRQKIEKEGMGLFLAVSRGAAVDPAFIILEYQGDPKSTKRSVVIGKGVTYDTGGLNLKPTGHMETMRTDMAGAAAAFGLIQALAEAALPTNVTVIVAATENAIGSLSYKPGDTYIGYSGKTVEIHNTDAEGRLTLADALAFAVEAYAPQQVIDMATLTGAIIIALGEEVAGLMSNNDALAQELLVAGEASGEPLWRMPLRPSYKKLLKSSVADIKNCGSRSASSITAGLFLQEFVGETPWAHLDIAGTAFPDKPTSLAPDRATGFGVRLLFQFFLRGTK